MGERAAPSPPARPSWTLTTLDLSLTHSRPLAGDAWVEEEARGRRMSPGTQGDLGAGLAYARGRWQAGLLWRGRWGEDLEAQGRFDEAFVLLRLAGISARLGRAPILWAPARYADLLVSAHARPLDHLRLTGAARRLPGIGGGGEAETFVAYLDDAHRAIPHPLLWGMRARWSPIPELSLEAQRTILMGGAGRTRKLTAGDLWDIFIARGEGTSGAAPGPEHFSARETDQKFAWQGVVRMPQRTARALRLREAEGFYIYAGEDRFAGLLPMAPARAWGLRVHPAAGWALSFVRASTACRENIWYRHKAYTSGYTYRGFGLGHPMGSDAKGWELGFFARLGGGDFLAARLARETRGHYNVARGIVPGGHWRWSASLSSATGRARVTAEVGAATAWGGDLDGSRPAEGIARVSVSLVRPAARPAERESLGWSRPVTGLAGPVP